jgi:hypothetical protein
LLGVIRVTPVTATKTSKDKNACPTCIQITWNETSFQWLCHRFKKWKAANKSEGEGGLSEPRLDWKSSICIFYQKSV